MKSAKATAGQEKFVKLSLIRTGANLTNKTKTPESKGIFRKMEKTRWLLQAPERPRHRSARGTGVPAAPECPRSQIRHLGGDPVWAVSLFIPPALLFDLPKT